jgi:hypothetical protein
MKMKITLKQWTEIGKFNRYRKWLQPLCNYRLIKKENGDYERRQQIKWWFYLLILLPMHIVDLCVCLWDGGLKTFEIQKNPVNSDKIGKGTKSWERANDIYERSNRKI